MAWKRAVTKNSKTAVFRPLHGEAEVWIDKLDYNNLKISHKK
jgi:hypothetical protein